MEKLLNRINELARKAKTADGLTETEKIEQKELRQQYLRSFRSSFDDILLNSKVVDPKGNDITPKKLVEVQKDKRRNEVKNIFGGKNVVHLHPEDADKK